MGTTAISSAPHFSRAQDGPSVKGSCQAEATFGSRKTRSSWPCTSSRRAGRAGQAVWGPLVSRIARSPGSQNDASHEWQSPTAFTVPLLEM